MARVEIYSDYLEGASLRQLADEQRSILASGKACPALRFGGRMKRFIDCPKGMAMPKEAKRQTPVLTPGQASGQAEQPHRDAYGKTTYRGSTAVVEQAHHCKGRAELWG